MNLFTEAARVHSPKETRVPNQFFPEQIQAKSQNRVHDRLWVVETYVADQRTGQHLLFIHVLQQVLQIIDDGSHIVLSGHLSRKKRGEKTKVMPKMGRVGESQPKKIRCTMNKYQSILHVVYSIKIYIHMPGNSL